MCTSSTELRLTIVNKSRVRVGPAWERQQTLRGRGCPEPAPCFLFFLFWLSVVRGNRYLSYLMTFWRGIITWQAVLASMSPLGPRWKVIGCTIHMGSHCNGLDKIESFGIRADWTSKIACSLENVFHGPPLPLNCDILTSFHVYLMLSSPIYLLLVCKLRI